MSDNLELELVIRALVQGLSDLKGLDTALTGLFGKSGQLGAAFDQLNKNMAAGFAISAKASTDAANKIVDNQNRIGAAARAATEEHRKAAEAAREQAQANRDLRAVLGAAGGGLLGGLLGASGVSPGAGAAILGIEAVKKAFSEVVEVVEFAAGKVTDFLVSTAALGLKTAADLERVKVAVGTIISGDTGVSENRGIEIAAAQIRILQGEAIKLGLDMDGLAKSFLETSAITLKYGVSVGQARDLTVEAAQAARVLGVNADQAGQFIGQVFAGNIRITNPLVRKLGAVELRELSSQFKEGKITGEQFASSLQGMFAKFKDAGAIIADTAAGIQGSLQSIAQVIAVNLTDGLFADLKQAGLDIKTAFFNVGGEGSLISPKMQPLLATLREVYNIIGSALLSALDKTLQYVQDISTWIAKNPDKVNEILAGLSATLSVLGDLLTDITDFAGEVFRSSDATGSLGEKMVVLAATFKFILENAKRFGDIIGDIINGDFLSLAKHIKEVGKSLEDTANQVADDYAAALGKVRDINLGFGTGTPGNAGSGTEGTITNQPEDPKKAREEAHKAFEEMLKLDENSVKESEANISLFEKAGREAVESGLVNLTTGMTTTWKDYYRGLHDLRAAALEEAIAFKDKEIAEAQKAGEKDSVIEKLKSQRNLLKSQMDAIDIELDANNLKIEKKGEELVAKLDDGIAKAAGGPRAKAAIKLYELELMKQFQGQELTPEIKAKIKLDIDLKAAALTFADLKTEFDQTVEKMKAKAAEIRAAVSSGALSPNAGAKEEKANLSGGATILSSLIAQMQAIPNLGAADIATLEKLKGVAATTAAEAKKANDVMAKTLNQVGQQLGSGLLNAFGAVIDGTKSVKQAFADMAKDMLKQLAMLIIKTLLLKAIGGMGGAGGTGFWGGMFSALGGTAAAGHASGGYISGPGTGTSDSIPARLSNGEYVIKADAVRRRGVAFMDWVNNPKYAEGGLVTRNGWSAASQTGSPDMNIAIGLTDNRQSTEDFLKSAKGQKLHVEIADKNQVVLSRIINRG